MLQFSELYLDEIQNLKIENAFHGSACHLCCAFLPCKVETVSGPSWTDENVEGENL